MSFLRHGLLLVFGLKSHEFGARGLVAGDSLDAANASLPRFGRKVFSRLVRTRDLPRGVTSGRAVPGKQLQFQDEPQVGADQSTVWWKNPSAASSRIFRIQKFWSRRSQSSADWDHKSVLCHPVDEARVAELENLPILEVLAQTPHVSGFCFFSYSQKWVLGCARAIEEQYFPQYAMDQRWGGHYETYVQELVSSRKDHAKLRVDYDEGSFVTYNDVYIYDDFYCHANSWLDLPSEIAYNATALNELSDATCDELGELFPESANWTMLGYGKDRPTDGWADDPELIWYNSFYQFEAPKKRDAQAHAMWKCLMGGLSCDISFCTMNFCTLEDGTIGHIEECPDDLPPTKYAALHPDWTRPKDISKDLFYNVMTGSTLKHRRRPLP